MNIRSRVSCLSGAVAVALLVPSTALLAQGSTWASADGAANPAANCVGGAAFRSGPTQSQVSCDVSIMSYDQGSTSLNGRIATASSLVAAPGGLAGQGSGWAQAQSRWREEVRFATGSLIPRYARVNARFTGALSSYFPNPALYGSDARITMSLSGASLDGVSSQYVYNQFMLNTYVDGDPAEHLNQSYDESLGIEIAISNLGSSSGFFFEQLLLTRTDVSTHYSRASQGGHAISDFAGVIDGLSFYDANRNDITDVVEYEMRYGTALAVTSTPEPASLALLGTGLIGVIAAARRRRARGA